MAETKESYEAELSWLEEVISSRINSPDYPDVTESAAKILITRVRYFLKEPYVFKEINGGWRIGAKNQPLTIKTTASEGFKFAGEVMQLNPVFIPSEKPKEIYALHVSYAVHGWPESNTEYSNEFYGLSPQERDVQTMGLALDSAYQSLTDTERENIDRLKKHIGELGDDINNPDINAEWKDEKVKEQNACIKELCRHYKNDGTFMNYSRVQESGQEKSRDNVCKGIRKMLKIIRDDSNDPKTGKEIADFIEARITPLKNPLCYTPRAGDPPWEF